MSNPRACTLVVDFSVMPSRPEPAAVEDFIYNKVKLEQADALTIQFHNIHRRVYIQMADNDKPLEYQRAHNYKHTMLADNKRAYKIPVYSEDGAVTVRIHDLPPSLPHTTVHAHMSQYGRVLFVRSEHWKNFFGGIRNGVRVLRMHLDKPIPSYMKIDSHETYVTHNGNQVKTCRFCDKPLHPKTKCGGVAQWQEAATASQQTPHTSSSSNEFPELSSANANTRKQNDLPKKGETQQQQQQEQQHQQKQQQKQQQKEQQTQKQHDDDDVDDDDGSSSTESNDFTTIQTKRRPSTQKGNNKKKPCQLDSPTGNIATQNCFVALSPVHGCTEGNVVPKNN